MDSRVLRYFMPTLVFTILLKYVNRTRHQSKALFIVALSAIVLSDFLTFYDYHAYFMWITILTSTYLICCSFIIIKYLNKGKLKAMLYFSVFIGFLLATYIVYSVLDLIINYLPEGMLLFVLFAALCLLCFIIICSMIYVNDNYDNATLLLGSVIFNMFHMGLSPINEFISYNATFTVLIAIAHILAIYLFMKFISETKIIKAEDVKEKFF
ncbi:hypothetical protein CW732_12930 [Olleya sp. Bg11-27]|nr:hypothetical protein CW732_12930 [Olleya sp. Bg11-27]